MPLSRVRRPRLLVRLSVGVWPSAMWRCGCPLSSASLSELLLICPRSWCEPRSRYELRSNGVPRSWCVLRSRYLRPGVVGVDPPATDVANRVAIIDGIILLRRGKTEDGGGFSVGA
jgi:hypothetical protein